MSCTQTTPDSNYLRQQIYFMLTQCKLYGTYVSNMHTYIHTHTVQTYVSACVCKIIYIYTVHTYTQYTVTPGLSDTGLSENLIYPTLCCDSPPSLCVLFTLIYPTPGLSDTFCEEQTWSDKPGPTVHTYVHTAVYIKLNTF